MSDVPKVIQTIYEENKVKDLILFRVEKYNNQSYKVVSEKLELSLNENGLCFKIPKKFNGETQFLTKEDFEAVASHWCSVKIESILLEEKYAYYTLLSYKGIEFAFVAEKECNSLMHLDTCTDNELIESAFTNRVRNVFNSLFGKGNL